jgi:PAS domain S-box-containing protein
MNKNGLKTATLIGVVSLISWGFLHIEPEHKAISEAISENINALNILETKIDRDFLNTQLNLTSINYDTLNYHLHSTRAKQNELLNIVNALNADNKHDEMLRAAQAYLELAAIKEGNLGTLKSETAVLSNSLHYLRNDYVPFLQQSNLDKNLANTLGELFNELVLYNINPDNVQLKRNILRIVGLLSEQKKAQAPENIVFLDKILMHSSIVLENTALLNRLVKKLNRLEIPSALENIELANQKMLAEEIKQANQYRLFLGVITFLLLVGIVDAVRRNEKSAFLLAESMRELELQKYALDRHAIVSIADKAGKITYANEKFLEISHYSLSELVGQDHRLLNSGVHPQQFFIEMWRTISTGNVWKADVCNRAKNGQLYWVQSTIVPFLDALGNVDHYISIRTDITAQKEMEQAAIKSEEWQRTILNNLADGVYLLDADGKTTYLNSMAEELLGFSLADVKGAFLHDIIHHHKPDGSILPYYECPIGLSMQQRKIYKSDNEMFFRKNGEGFPVSMGAVPIYENDKIVGSVACFRDITQQRATQAELIRAKNAAEKALQVKSDFLSTMSHEIRTPMNGVLGMTELLLDTNLLPTQKKYVDAIYSSADSLLCIINDILDFSKLESEKLELENIDFNLSELVTQTMSFFEESAKKKSIWLNCDIEKNLPHNVCGDPNRIRQILTNLLSNAIKFTNKGGVSLKIDLDSPVEKDEFFTVLFCVHDTGIGISQEALPRLFHSFSQADSSTTRKYGGTGLGLAISKNLAILMGGDITITSKEGEGSEFCFKICLKTAHAQVETLPVLESPNKTSTPLTTGLNVLVAEDNLINQEVIKATMQKLGCHIFLAATGEEAFERWHNGGMDLILMDCMMPDVDGYQSTQRIREEEKQADLPRTYIIALTANAMTGDRERCLEAGMDDYLTKPFQIEVLREKLETLIQSGIIATKKLAVLDEKIDTKPLNVLREMGGDELVEKVLALFFEDTAALIEELKTAISDNNVEAVRRFSHSIKSSAATVGAGETVEIALTIETFAREGEVCDVAKMNELECSYLDAVKILKNGA